MFSMLLLVLADNFLLLFAAWELVGLSSYLLIGFWYRRRSAALANKKAFLVNRVGDFGFALGIFAVWTTVGTLNFGEVFELLPAALHSGAIEAWSTNGIEHDQKSYSAVPRSPPSSRRKNSVHARIPSELM